MKPYEAILTHGCETLLRLEFSERAPLCDAALAGIPLQRFYADGLGEKMRWRIGRKAVRQLHLSRIKQGCSAMSEEGILPIQLAGLPINP
jgi:hypothetical protein